MTELTIKKICHECGKPLTCNPRAASVPGEICVECFNKRWEDHKLCDLCHKPTEDQLHIKLSASCSDSSLDSDAEVHICEKCYNRIFEPTLVTFSTKCKKETE